MKRTRASREEWVRRVAEWRASGETAESFATARGWSARTLSWWASVGHRKQQATPAPPPLSFVEVTARRPERAERSVMAVEVCLRNGRRVRVRGDVDVDRLRALLVALEG
jgi:hypothetical protein